MIAGEDTRLWVQDHYSDEWHWYRDGHYEMAVCGADPIPGSPLVAEDIEPGACQKCKKIYLSRTTKATVVVGQLSTRAEFDAEVARLAQERPLLKTLLSQLPKGFDTLSDTLKAEVYGITGLIPIQMYERVADYDSTRKYIFGRLVSKSDNGRIQ